jgi:hypothetical protein
MTMIAIPANPTIAELKRDVFGVGASVIFTSFLGMKD